MDEITSGENDAVAAALCFALVARYRYSMKSPPMRPIRTIESVYSCVSVHKFRTFLCTRMNRAYRPRNLMQFQLAQRTHVRSLPHGYSSLSLSRPFDYHRLIIPVDLAPSRDALESTTTGDRRDIAIYFLESPTSISRSDVW